MALSFKEFERQGWESVAKAYHECFGGITSEVALALVNNAMIKQNDRILASPAMPAPITITLGLICSEEREDVKESSMNFSIGKF
ncbi:MAG: hypothetical protein V4489_06485 [Chlamydiota bacterium]